MSTYISHLSELDANQLYTYADYLTWRFEQRVELINGKVFKMSPATNVRHQRISSRLHGNLFKYFQHHSCELFAAPFDVRLLNVQKTSKADQEIYTVVQPDICIICDSAKLDARGCLGDPDLIVEILSPGNSKKEMKLKYALYEESGVQEYWIVYPSEHVLQQFVLTEANRYELKESFAEDEVVHAHIFPDAAINLAEVFAE